MSEQSAGEVLYPNQGQTSAPMREDYRKAAPAPAATPAASSVAAPVVDPATNSIEPPAEPLTPAQLLYGSDNATLGNRLAAEGIRKDGAPTVDVPPASGEQPKPDAGAEAKAEPEIDTTLPKEYLNVRFNEPAPSNPSDLSAIMEPAGSFDRGPDFELLAPALHAAEIGVTATGYLMSEVNNFAKNGPSSDTPESATATLEAWFPGKAADHIANANKMIDRMAVKWPNIREELNKTNLGNNPRIIRALAEVYAARPRR